MDPRNPLLFPDLFHTILDHLSEYETPDLRVNDCRYELHLVDRDGRAALLALAQTRRDFSEPSLDRLWRDLGSLIPLIRCYGGDPTIRYKKKTLTPPTSDELPVNIIRRYSPRIRTLYLRESLSMLLLRHIGSQSRTIRLTQPQRSQLTPGRLSSDLPSLLTSFRHLETLVIELGNISIDDDQLADLGCLRSLRVLKLTSWAASWPLVKHPTLHGVLSLVGSCQQLQELTLSVDARQVPRDADADICNTTLTKLTFLSPIDDSGCVARFISKHLPSVKYVSRDSSVTELPWHNWGGWFAVTFKLRWGLDRDPNDE